MRLKSTLESTIEEYNKYRKPEAVARIVWVEDGGFKLEFSGPFCQSCGVQGYFEDVIYELERLNGVKASLLSVQEIKPGVYRVAYSIDRSSSEF